ncbi:hypothetical protein GCM10009128_26200 [Psychrosphaera haliotis]|uniref:hypothetical protein n=1 Tax=Psychrosphaera haliotis TaxID=555083 RepID=UPI0031D22566
MKKRNGHLLIALSVSIALAACNNDQSKEKQDAPSVPNAMQDKNVVAEDMKSVSSQVQEIKQPMALEQALSKGFVKVNNTILEAPSLPLIAGKEVFDKSVNQKARVTGNIIVVVADGAGTSQWLSEFDMVEMASNTYSLTPKNPTDLVLDYKTLKRNKSVKQVELQLDYTPKSDKETM